MRGINFSKIFNDLILKDKGITGWFSPDMHHRQIYGLTDMQL